MWTESEDVYDGNGNAKGNCDADLVLTATMDHYEKGISSVVLVPIVYLEDVKHKLWYQPK
jgi:hypothetical protein